MFYENGTLYESCDHCGVKVEVDDAEDAKGWGINHWAAFHSENE